MGIVWAIAVVLLALWVLGTVVGGLSALPELMAAFRPTRQRAVPKKRRLP